MCVNLNLVDNLQRLPLLTNFFLMPQIWRFFSCLISLIQELILFLLFLFTHSVVYIILCKHISSWKICERKVKQTKNILRLRNMANNPEIEKKIFQIALELFSQIIISRFQKNKPFCGIHFLLFYSKH